VWGRTLHGRCRGVASIACCERFRPTAILQTRGIRGLRTAASRANASVRLAELLHGLAGLCAYRLRAHHFVQQSFLPKCWLFPSYLRTSHGCLSQGAFVHQAPIPGSRKAPRLPFVSKAFLCTAWHAQVNFLSHWYLAHVLLGEQRRRRASIRQQHHASAAAPRNAAGSAGAQASGRPLDDNAGLWPGWLPRGWGLGASSSSNSSRLPFDGWGLPDDATRVVMVSSLTHHAGILNWGDMQVRDVQGASG
jgi:hypothetical protein